MMPSLISMGSIIQILPQNHLRVEMISPSQIMGPKIRISGDGPTILIKGGKEVSSSPKKILVYGITPNEFDVAQGELIFCQKIPNLSITEITFEGYYLSIFVKTPFQSYAKRPDFNFMDELKNL